MANMTRRILRGAFGLTTIGGMTLIGRAFQPNPAFDKEMEEKGKIVHEAREKYGVGMTCFSGGGAWGTVGCYDTVPKAKTRAEQDAILARYHDEIKRRQALMPVDPEAHKQAERDGLGLLIGMPMTSLGIIGFALVGEMEEKKGKQYQNSIERRKGRRKEGM